MIYNEKNIIIFSNSHTMLLFDYSIAGIILCMHPAKERWRYIVALSLIGWVHTQNGAW